MTTYKLCSINDGTTSLIHINDLKNGDTSEPIELAEFQDRSVQVFGAFGAGGSVAVEGSNDGVNYAPLTNASGGLALTFTTAGLKQILEASRWVRLKVTAGDGSTNINASVFMRRASSIRT